MSHTVSVYRDKRGEWRWRREAANGQIVSESGEGYKRRYVCKAMAEKVNAGDFEVRIKK